MTRRLRSNSPLVAANHAAAVQRSAAPPSGHWRLDFSDIDAPRLTHYLFRFPAKFHPPVVHALIRNYTSPGETLLDPFCGSGTLLLAAAVEGRHAIGSDVDPVAVFVARGKTHRLRPGHLRTSWAVLDQLLEVIARSAEEYEKRRFVDITVEEYEQALSDEGLWVPEIPHLMHWFRRYVVVDLARINRAILHAAMPETHRAFFLLVHSSIIRNASNADPVPVSGLEVTSYMKERDAAGRTINPFGLFRKATEKGLAAVEEYFEASGPGSRVSVIHADAKSLSKRVRRQVDAVITSPPYHNAVDYYRRHQLEMFWLGLTETHADRLKLLPRYVGRARVRMGDPALQRLDELGTLSSSWYEKMQAVSVHRANAFAHYVLSMKDVFRQIGALLRPGRPAVFVLGHSEWKGTTIPTSDLFVEMAGDGFRLTDRLWYPVKNRYMSYGRHNGDGINHEYVLVLTKTDQPPGATSRSRS